VDGRVTYLERLAEELGFGRLSYYGDQRRHQPLKLVRREDFWRQLLNAGVLKHQQAYSATRTSWAMAELETYATDGELDSVRAELPAA